MKNMKQRKAFTIVEMVIVIAVVAVLAAVMIPTVAGVINMANVSADEQFAASLNVQLAMWEVDYGPIDSESDLREAINWYYGDEGTEDFYKDLAPKSGKQGYHYWYDVENKQVLLERYEDLKSGNNRAANNSFSPESPRSIQKGSRTYFLVDRKGSDVADLINEFETLPSASAYKEAIEKMNALIAEGAGKDSEILASFAADIETTTIITDGGAFRYGSADYESGEEAIKYVWIPVNPKTLQQTKVYVYNGTDVDDGQHSNAIATKDVITKIEIPSDVHVSIDGLSAIYVDTYADDQTNRDYAGTTKLYVNVDEVADLQKIFTDCVLVMPDESEYIFVGDKIYSLPLTIDPVTKLPTGNSVGSVDNSVMEGIDDFDIECIGSHGQIGKNLLYHRTDTDTLYVAYDKKDFELSLTAGVTDGMVTWSSSNDLATVNSNGMVELQTLPGTNANENYGFVITATYKYDDSKKATINVEIVRPKTVSLTIGGVDFTVYNNPNKVPVEITYNGNNGSNPIVVGEPVYNWVDYVVTGACEFKYSTTGSLFSIQDGNLVINEDALSAVAGEGADKRTQDLTITYQVKDATASDDDNIKYLTITYAITFIDSSSVALQPNLIVDQDKDGEFDEGKDTYIGKDYLFRVGNGNAFTLADLFRAEKANKNVVVTGVKIYDKIIGDKVEISTSSGFSATYTTNADWKKSTIKFSGTGVAVIQVNTAQGPSSVAVEVVNGKNVTAGTYSSLSGNVVLLSDITLTGAFNYNNSTLYGNGFTIDASSYKAGGNYMISINNTTLDHVSIVGKDYPKLEETSSNDYYSSLVMIAGGDCTLLNSYFRGTRSPVWIKSGTLTIKDSVCDGGTLAALHISGGTSVVLDNVTLKQEAREGKLGAGVLVDETAPLSTEIEIINGFNAYTWFAKSDISKLPDDFQKPMEGLFGNSYVGYHHTVDGGTKINMGIIYESNPAVAKPVYDDLKFNTIDMTGGVKIYTIQTDSGTATTKLYTVPGAELMTTYAGVLEQGATKPTYTFNTTDGYEANKNDGETPYYEYSSTEKSILIGFEKGKSLTLKLLNATDAKKRLTLTKYGKDCFEYVEVAVKDANGNNLTVTDGEVTFSAEGVYTVIYSFDDPFQYDPSGVLKTDASAHHEWKVSIKVTPFDPKAKNAEFTFTGFTGTKEVTIDGTIYIMPDISTGSAETQTITVGNQTIYAPLIEGKDDGNGNNDTIRYYQIFGGVTIVDGDTTYSSSTQTFPGAKLTWISSKLVSGKLDKGDGEISQRKATPKYNKTYGGLCYATNAIGTDVDQAAGKTGCPETTAILGFTYTDEAGKTVTYYIGYHFEKRESSGSCLAAGTMITLADGSKKAVEDLRKGDIVMSFDHLTGKIVYKDVIIVVKTASESYYKNTFVFDDGTELVTINEHGIYDLNLNKYVNIDHLNYTEYLGHSFVSVDSQGNIGVKKLVDVKTVCEGGYKYDIVTEGTLNYVAEDTLSVTHVLVDVINSFDFGADLKYDAEKMQADIEKYGLYDYAEWEEYCDISVFDQYNIPVMKVGISKGLYTKDYIIGLINTYVLDDSVQIID